MLKRKKNKESNRAYTPEESQNTQSKKKVNTFFLIFTVLSIALYTCYTFFVIYKLSRKTFLSKIIIYLLALYVLIFLLLILINLRNKRKMKNQLKDYKSATKFLKYSIQILNLILSIATAISAFITTGEADINAIAYAIFSILIILVYVFIEIISIKIRKNMPIIKQNFLDLHEKPVKKNKEK